MGIKQSLISLGELPYRHSTVTIRDFGELVAENCTAVVSCTDSREKSGEIVLKLRDRLIRVRGCDLRLESFGAYGVRILGSIQAVEFLEL
ncbi:MAG: YabP/YqfC family sporulation protein [Oscillospiraceae bacterium]